MSESLKIEDYDIATVEHLHDCLIEKEGYSLEHPMLERSRELTAKLYKIVYSTVQDHRIITCPHGLLLTEGCFTCLEEYHVKDRPLGAGFAHKDTKKGIQDDPER